MHAGHDAASGRAPLPTVTTVLTPNERLRVDAAGQGLYRALHRETLDDVLRDLRHRPVGAVLVSTACCREGDEARVAAVVREFPRVPAVALLAELAEPTPRVVLALGRSGIRTLVDVRRPDGWRALRDVLVVEGGDAICRVAIERLADDLAGAREDCRRFFEALFTCPPGLATVRELARALHVLPSTLMSRFFRSRLPAPKRYLAMARLVRAARLFENPGLSIAGVANRLEYSSPQSFGRHVRTMLGMTALEFRRRYDGEGMLQRFREELVLPYLPALRALTPLTSLPGWSPGRSADAPASASPSCSRRSG